MSVEESAQRLKAAGRNDPCPCGSGKKYKKCHQAEDEAAVRAEHVRLAAAEAAAAEAAAAEAAEAPKDEGRDKPERRRDPAPQPRPQPSRSQTAGAGKANLPRRGAI